MPRRTDHLPGRKEKSMEVLNCSFHSLPKMDYVFYQDISPEEAAAKFEKRYGEKPQQIYKVGKYVYIPAIRQERLI
jgi:hypothetical protein